MVGTILEVLVFSARIPATYIKGRGSDILGISGDRGLLASLDVCEQILIVRRFIASLITRHSSVDCEMKG
jgi:hypothetical protein